MKVEETAGLLRTFIYKMLMYCRAVVCVRVRPPLLSGKWQKPTPEQPTQRQTDNKSMNEATLAEGTWAQDVRARMCAYDVYVCVCVCVGRQLGSSAAGVLAALNEREISLNCALAAKESSVRVEILQRTHSFACLRKPIRNPCTVFSQPTYQVLQWRK